MEASADGFRAYSGGDEQAIHAGRAVIRLAIGRGQRRLVKVNAKFVLCDVPPKLAYNTNSGKSCLREALEGRSISGQLSANNFIFTQSRKKGRALKKSHVDKLSLAIAVCALGLSLWQGYQQRVQNHVAVEPRINAYFKLDGKTDQNGLYVFNNGLGPAYVESLEVTVAGKLVTDNSYGRFGGAVQSMRLDTDCLTIGGPRPNDSLKLGEEIGLIEISKNAQSACALTKLLLGAKIQQHLDFTLIVKSIYGDRFQYNFKNNIQTAL